jgi:uncharacterized protein
MKSSWIAVLLLLVLASTAAAQCVPLAAVSVAYNQDFNTLASTGTTNTAVPAGWAFFETGTNANTTYRADTGSGATGDTYSYGSAGSAERAFGTLFSNSLVPTIGGCFVNNTGGPIHSLAIVYTGEQWRLGATGRQDRLDFQYSLNATSLSTGTWTDVNTLDFLAPNTTGTAGPLDGNSAANRAVLSDLITGLSIPDGTTFWIRWADFNATSSDDGLAVDDFALTPQTQAVSVSPSTWGSVKTMYR